MRGGAFIVNGIPYSTLTAVLALVCLFLLVGLIVLFIKLHANRNNRSEYWHTLQKTYFKITESLTRTISDGHPFRHSAADYNNSLTDLLKIDKLVIYIIMRNRFAPVIWHGINMPGINKLFFATSSELVKNLSATGKPIKFDSDPPKDNLGKLLYEKQGMKSAYPLLFGRRLHGLVIMSDSSQYDMEDIAGYILSLSDILAFAFEMSYRKPSSPKRFLDRDKESVRNESVNDKNRTQNKNYYPLFEAQTQLLRIYNENHLMETFLRILENHLHPSFSFISLPNDKGDSLQIKYKTKNLPDQLLVYRIRSSDSLLRILSREYGVHKMDQIRDTLGVETSVKFLSEAGCILLASFPLPGRKTGVIGIGKKASGQNEYSSSEISIISSLCQTLQMILDNIRQFKKIEELSYTDSMTNMYNYRYFYKRLGEEILRARRFERFLSLVIFDVDEFKIINDSYGHQTGDAILKQLGELIHDSVRSIDIVSRYGGEEFCVIMPESDRDSCELFMERLRVKISSFKFKNRTGGKSLNISVSLGGAIFPSDAKRIDRLIYCADMALLSAKKSGRNRFSLYNSTAESS
jgi:diguanylate cyclase (GGDEF)-like protein